MFLSFQASPRENFGYFFYLRMRGMHVTVTLPGNGWSTWWKVTVNTTSTTMRSRAPTSTRTGHSWKVSCDVQVLHYVESWCVWWYCICSISVWANALSLHFMVLHSLNYRWVDFTMTLELIIAFQRLFRYVASVSG